MFVIKEFKNEELEEFFDIISEIGIVEIEADWAAQNNFEEFNFFCWNSKNEEIDINESLLLNDNYSKIILSHTNLFNYLNKFLMGCIPMDYKEKFGSFGIIKFKIKDRDYEIIKFDYSELLD
jgi:hypothetical protein